MNLRSVFFRSRRVPVPTAWGWLVLALAVVAAVLALGRQAYGFMAVNAPARGPSGQGARVLIVEGWLFADDLDQALPLIRQGRYERVLTTGGPIESWDGASAWPNYAERAAFYLRQRGPLSTPVVAAGAPASAQDRSYLSAVMARDWLQANGVNVAAIDLFSAGVHARRSRLVYRLAFGEGVEVGVMAARARTYDPDHWWRSSSGVKTVIGEALSLAWTSCCFWPPPRGSHEERWAVPPRASAPQP